MQCRNFSSGMINRRATNSHWLLSPVPPDILDYPTSTDMVVREGSNVSLICSATGSPTPNITWRRENGERIMLLGGSEGEWYAGEGC